MFNNESDTTADDVLNKLSSNADPEQIRDAIDDALQREYLEGKKVGELAGNDQGRKMQVLIGVAILSLANTVILGLQAAGYL